MCCIAGQATAMVDLVYCARHASSRAMGKFMSRLERFVKEMDKLCPVLVPPSLRFKQLKGVLQVKFSYTCMYMCSLTYVQFFFSLLESDQNSNNVYFAGASLACASHSLHKGWWWASIPQFILWTV